MAKRGLCMLLAVLTALTLCASAFASTEPEGDDRTAAQRLREAEPADAEKEAEAPAQAIIGFGSCGTQNSALSWILKGTLENVEQTDWELTVSGKGEMTGYEGGQPWANWMTQDGNGFQTLTVEEGVTSIGANAFSSAGALVNISLPVTLKAIRAGAFSGCTGLKSVLVPERVTSIEKNAFLHCDSMESILILNPDCVIETDDSSAEGIMTLGDPKRVVIYGRGGSTAETYAQQYGYPFKTLEEIAVARLEAPKLRGVENTANGVKIEWDKLEGVSKYRVYYRLDSENWLLIGETAGTSFMWTEPAVGTEYTFTVKAYNVASKAGKYDPDGLTIQYFLPAPGLIDARWGSGGVNIQWNRVAGAERYRVFYAAPDGNWIKVGDTGETNYVWTEGDPAVIYTFTVRCINNDATAYTSDYDRTGITPRNAVAPKLSGVESTDKGVKVTWEPVAGAFKYRVFYKTSGSWHIIEDTTDTSYVWEAAKSGTDYLFTVRCVSPEDDELFTTDFDPEGIRLTYIAAPKISGLEKTDAGVKVTWGAVEGAVNYRVFYKTSGGKWEAIADTASTELVWDGAVSGTEYAFTVRCVSGDGTAYASAYDPKGKNITY